MEIAETTFYEEPRVLHDGAADGGEINVFGHTKRLCVNKLGHTMVVPPKDGTSQVKFGELFKKNRHKTISYCAVFLSFGMCVAFLGPTLLDLECRLASHFSTMSWIFFTQALFTLIGAACGGFLVQMFGQHILLLISTIMISLTLAVISSCKVLIWLSCVLAVMGFFMGTIDTVANIAMIQLYGRNVAPFLQALHFCYGLGAFISPLVAKPFLLNKDCSEVSVNASTPGHKIHVLRTDNLTDSDSESLNENHIEFAFWILSAMQTPVILLLLSLVLRDIFGWRANYEVNQPGFVETKEGIEMNKANYSEFEHHGGPDDDHPDVTKKQTILIIASTVALLFIYDGLQAGYADYIFSYAVKTIADMPKNEAAYLNSCFWGTFAFGRLISIGLATKLAPSLMLVTNIIGCTTAMILMLCFRQNITVLYIGTSIFGLFLSSVYPTAVSLAETYINVTSFITSILVAGAASGEMLMPVIFGYEFDGLGPSSILVSSLVMTLLSCFIFAFLTYVGKSIVRQSSEQSILQSIKNLFCRSGEEATEDSGLLSHHVKFYKRMRSETSVTDFKAPSTDDRNGHEGLDERNGGVVSEGWTGTVIAGDWNGSAGLEDRSGSVPVDDRNGAVMSRG